MSIVQIDLKLCNGCGICINSCTTDVIRMDEETKKALVKYAEDCILCEMCVQDCPQKAITVSPTKTSPLIVSWG